MERLAIETFLRERALSMYSSEGLLHEAKVFGSLSMLFSRVVFARLDFESGPREVVIKMVGEDPLVQGTIAEAVDREFEALRRFEEVFSAVTDLGVVTPVGLYPEEGVLVTEAFPGRSAHAIVTSSVSRFPFSSPIATGEALVRRCGRWLRRFQDSTRESIIPPARYQDAEIQRLQDRLEICVGFGLEPGQADRTVHAVQALTGTSSIHSKERTAVHGDFAPWNILVGDDEIRVLDFARYRNGSPSEDPAWFYCALESRKSILGTAPDRVERLQKAFFDELASPAVRSPEFRYRLCLSAVELASGTDPDVPTQKGWLRRLHERKWKRDGFNHLLDFALKSAEEK